MRLDFGHIFNECKSILHGGLSFCLLRNRVQKEADMVRVKQNAGSLFGDLFGVVCASNAVTF